MTPERFAKLKSALDRRQPDLTVFMDAVNKSRNVSAIIRTADGVGVHRLHALATGGALRRHHMIAGGARHYVGLTLHSSTAAALTALRADGWRLVAAHAGPKACDYRDVDYTAKVAIMVGAELDGLSEAALAAADSQVAIPMHGLGTSLNVSVAVGALLLEAERQRRAAGLYGVSRLTRADYDHTLFEWCYPEIAERCRELGREYPKLRDDGLMAANPLLDVVAD
ncbi:MAG: tRNA (guanine-N2)-dimethyltransferase [Lysobacterales bacterium]|nr:MAG: tRNA (guanine-N2)-dimethyltransferase [Xanthomonadales bacterium]